MPQRVSEMRVKTHSLQAVLQEVADMAASAMPHAHAVSATLLVADRESTVAFTDELAVRIDDAQYELGSGPLLDAMATDELVHVDHMATESRWDDFPQLAVSCGVLSAVSVPITVDLETRVSAALNIYSAHAHAFTTEDLHIAVRFASSAETSVLNAHDHETCRALVRQLASALETRPLIDQAKGVTMSAHGCTADEAARLLLTEARRSNRMLKDVAEDVLASV